MCQHGKRSQATNRRAHGQTDAGVDPLRSRGLHARSKAIRRRARASRWQRTRERARRTPRRVANERANARASRNHSYRSRAAVRPGIAESITIAALERCRAGDRRNVAIGKGDRHGLQPQLAALAMTLQFVELALYKRSRRNRDLVAGVDGRRNLRIDVIAAMKDPALHRLSKNHRNVRASRNGQEGNAIAGCHLRWFSWSIVLILALRSTKKTCQKNRGQSRAV